MKGKILWLIATLFVMNHLNAQILEVCIRNFRTCEGQLCVAVFNSESSFQKEEPVWEKYYPKEEFAGKSMKIIIQLTPGTYGITILDDINRDAKMNFNLIGIPQEGFGFGNYQHKGIFKPKFSVFSFQLEENQTKQIQVKIQYF